MTALHAFFDQNQPIIQFAYGLTFFVVGLAVALQSRSSSRLELARSLSWLAAFGLVHSLYVWGELFAPLNETFLGTKGTLALHASHLLLLGLSFTCLIEFGVALLRPLGQRRWLRWLSTGWLAVYILFIMIAIPGPQSNLEAWHNTAEAVARYTIGLPGGLLAAYGLREQTYRHIAPLEAPHVVSMLRLTGIALAAYAVVAGLFPPPVAFFPGNILNTNTFEQVVGIPTVVFESLLGLVLVFSVLRALEVFQVETERRIELMEQQQILAAERERIGRELHDGTVQTAYTVGLLIDSARKLVEPDSPVAIRLDRAVLVQDEVISDLRRNLGELRSQPTGELFADALKRITGDPRFRSLVDISLELDLPEDVAFLPRDTNHLLAIVYEALSNVIRHAHARRVHMTLRQEDDHYLLVIQDDGAGLPRELHEGFGLRNMQERARLLGGSLEVTSHAGKGATVTLEIPRKITVPIDALTGSKPHS